MVFVFDGFIGILADLLMKDWSGFKLPVVFSPGPPVDQSYPLWVYNTCGAFRYIKNKAVTFPQTRQPSEKVLGEFWRAQLSQTISAGSVGDP